MLESGEDGKAIDAGNVTAVFLGGEGDLRVEAVEVVVLLEHEAIG